MKNRLSIKLCQKNLLTEKKNTMSWENIAASLTCGRAKMPPRSLELAAGAIIFYTCAIKLKLFISKRLYYFMMINELYFA